MKRELLRALRARLSAAAVLALLLTGASGLTGQAGVLGRPGGGYTVYCVNGRVEISGRSVEEMRSARGSNVCPLSPTYGRLSEAEEAVKRHGGVGAACRCG